ncbi:hypothetical protein PINS_up022345 [Pythium insidiosum]|nr:hypothetical protein PINS_up022345 [Pythium insidiosum]
MAGPHSRDERHGRESDDASGGDAAFGTQEQDELMSEMILKHRSELQRFVERTMPLVGGHTSEISPATVFGAAESARNLYPPRPINVSTPPHETNTTSAFAPSFHTPQPTRSDAVERLPHLSRTERTDRMRLAELSDVRNERIGRAAVLKWNPEAKLARDRARDNRTFIGDSPVLDDTPIVRARRHTTPPRVAAKELGAYSRDYITQAMDFADVVDDDDDELPRRPRHEGDVDDDDDDDASEDGHDGGEVPSSPNSVHDMLNQHRRGKRSTKSVRKYVKHMEATIATLVQQKDELLRNQAEFDKHASGMFPTLETLNNQLSQIVHDRMLQSQANIKDDLDTELRVLRGRLNELEADSKQRRNDVELMEQKRQIDFAQVKGEIASLSTTGTLHNQKMELLTSQVKKSQDGINYAVQVMQELTQQHSAVEQRIASIESAMKTSISVEPQQHSRDWVSVVLAVMVALVIAFLLDSYHSALGGRH